MYTYLSECINLEWDGSKEYNFLIMDGLVVIKYTRMTLQINI